MMFILVSQRRKPHPMTFLLKLLNFHTGWTSGPDIWQLSVNLILTARKSRARTNCTSLPRLISPFLRGLSQSNCKYRHVNLVHTWRHQMAKLWFKKEDFCLMSHEDQSFTFTEVHGGGWQVYRPFAEAYRTRETTLVSWMKAWLKLDSMPKTRSSCRLRGVFFLKLESVSLNTTYFQRAWSVST